MGDPEKQSVYNAEFDLREIYDLCENVDDYRVDLFGWEMELPRERKFADVLSIERYYIAVCGLDSVKAKFPGIHAPSVRKRRGELFAHYEALGNVVAIPDTRSRWALRETVALHELAHACAPGAGHGVAFRRAFIFLVQQAMGAEAGMALNYFYDQHGVGLQTSKV